MADEPPTTPVPPQPSPYRIDVTITLGSGGTIRFIGQGLNRAGLHELLDLVSKAADQ